MISLPIAILLAAAPSQLTAAATETRAQVRAVRLAEPVSVDGALDEAVWKSAEAATSFLQREPTEGATPTERTELRIAYDDEAIYVGARMYDSQPKRIVSRLGRRDTWLDADALVVYLDPYHDGRSGYFFVVNAAGTLRDGTLYNDDWDDDSWDGIWEGKVKLDDAGWTAEMRIPYSQLRFRATDQYRWGINCRRYLGRNKEDDYLVYTPKNASGFVSRFPELAGIQGVTPARRIGVAPYTTTKAQFAGHDAADPFNDGSRLQSTLGADARLGLGSNLTLDATVNPDFGQVEVDPAVVNLSDVETFFQEKRPFFVAGSNLFSFGQGGASNYIGFNWAGADLFYSRRIGRTPQGPLPAADFSDAPTGTRLLGAGKLTGKLGEHWSVGTLHAVTGRESADLSIGGARSSVELEPRTYYGVFRAQREFPENRRGLGFMGTVVARDFKDARLRDELNSGAYVLGVDGWTFLDSSKTWVLTGWGGVSSVRGSATRLTALQEGAQHYFQRPDASHLRLDPTATSMTGSAGRLALNKEKGNVLFNAALGYIDPKFDVNDVGFLYRADVVNGHAWGSYRWTKPGRVARSANADFGVFRSYDFDGDRTTEGYFAFVGTQFLNYWRANAWVAYNPDTLNNTRTRGGPLMQAPHGAEWDVAARTDDRKDLWFRVATHGAEYARGSSHLRSASFRVEWKPRPNLAVSLAPEMEWNRDGAQWIGNYDDARAAATFGKRYVFASLDQKTFAAALRLDWTFTPRLSLQVYAQPLVSSGAYTGFGELARPRSFDFVRYAPGLAPVELPNPDFNFKSLRGNAVLRWEFRPGSTAYFVWTQNRADTETIGELELGRSLSRLLNSKADNVLLLKVTYWWSR